MNKFVITSIIYALMSHYVLCFRSPVVPSFNKYWDSCWSSFLM